MLCTQICLVDGQQKNSPASFDQEIFDREMKTASLGQEDNENGFARAFGGDSGTCVCRGKMTSRLSPCFAVELRILLSSILARRIR
jgi:hypothetical protein